MDEELKELKAIAGVYRKRGMLRLAADVLQTAIQIENTAHGGDTIQSAQLMTELAEVYCDMNRFSEARLLINRAATIWQTNRHHAAQDIITMADTLARLHDEFERDIQDGDEQAESEAA